MANALRNQDMTASVWVRATQRLLLPASHSPLNVPCIVSPCVRMSEPSASEAPGRAPGHAIQLLVP